MTTFVDLVTRLNEHTSAEPGRRALTFLSADRTGHREELTYGELAARVRVLGERLARQLAPGERVLLALPPTADFAVSFLACLASGVVAVPLPVPGSPATRRRLIAAAADCAPAAIIATRAVRESFPPGSPEADQLRACAWILVDERPYDSAVAAPAALPTPAVGPDDVAFLQYTSGSTAAARGVMVTHGGLMANEAAIRDAFGVTPHSTIVSWLPLHHDMGLIGGLLQPLHTGARSVILDPMTFLRRPGAWLATISAERADISGAPNFAYDLCARTVSAAEKDGLDLSSWRVAFNGAAPVFPQTLDHFSEVFAQAGFRPDAHVPCYGLAEATLLVARVHRTRTAWFTTASLERGDAVPADAHEAGARVLIAYAMPDHATVRIVDPATLEPLPDGRIGEIVVAGPSNGRGYFNDPVESAGTFGLSLPGDAATFLRTGDLGFVHDGRLYVSGRHKDLIVHRGRNIHPEDVEADLAGADPAVRSGRAAVLSVPDGGDEALVAAQEIRPDTPADRYPTIAAALRDAVARAHDVTLHTVVLLPPNSIARTTSGKTERHTVRRRFLAGELRPYHTSTLAAPTPSATRLSTRLRAALAEAAPADRAGVVTDVLRAHLREVLRLAETPAGTAAPAALGADSLLAVQVQNELEEALGTALRPTLMLRAGSIREVAETACAAAQEAVPVVEPAADAYELSDAQRALWFLQRADPDDFGYTVTRAFRLTGPVDTDAAEAALATVVARHPSLRLSVHTVEGEPRAVVRPEQPVALRIIDAREWADADEAEWYEAFATTPFDLADDPLVRAALLRRPGSWLLVLSVHHIACDMASLAVIVTDFARAYARETLEPAARQPVIHPKDAARTAAYWKATLDGDLPVLVLPRLGDVPAVRGRRGAGAVLSLDLPAAVAEALTGFAREAGLTLHNVMLAAYQVMLHRLTGQDDLLIGVPTLGRDDRRAAAWVGYLVNAVPVRSAYAPDQRFDEAARRTQASVLDALDHRDLSLAAITRLVNPERLGAATTLFQAMFEFYSTAVAGGEDAAAAVLGDPSAEVHVGACTLRGRAMPEHTAQADISVNVAAIRGTVQVRLQYRTEAVAPEQAQLLLTTFATLLRAVAADPHRPVRTLPLQTPEQIHELVAAGTGPRVERTEHYVESFERLARTQPDAIAVDDGSVSLTYAQLDRRADHVAARLRACGVGVDATVVVSAGRGADYVVAVLGVHKADGSYVPISPAEAPRRAAAMIDAVRPVVCIADEAGAGLLTAASPHTPARPGLLDLADVTGGETAGPAKHLCPRDGAGFVIHTSGSTGTPKSVVVTNQGMTNHIWQMLEHFDFGPGDCLAQTAPVSFDISVWQLLAPLAVGGRVRVVPDPVAQSPAGLLRTVREGGVTVLELVPSMITALLDAGLAAAPGALRVMISTGDSLTYDVADRWRTELPAVPLFNAYGPAECSDDVTMGRCALGPGPVSPTIGRPLANTSVLVLDRDFVPVPSGVVGTLCVGGSAVGRGYLGDPRRTAEVFVPDPWSTTPGARMYVTGDLGRSAPGGDLEFLGREDTQIKLRGIRIEAGEVEAALRACPGVADSVVKVERGASGPVLVGYVAFRAASAEQGSGTGATRLLDTVEVAALRPVLEQRLPRQMIPTVFVRVERLPRSKNGKLDHGALSHRDAVRTGDDDGDRSDDPLATTVRGIWATVLQQPTVGWNDSFFHLGGHSLSALTMLDSVSRALSVDLGVDAVFAHSRLRDFVEAVRTAEVPPAVGPAAGTPRADATAVPASAAQLRFWYLHELDPGRPTYNMPGVLRIRGPLDEDALQAALHATVSGHPVLLARFSTGGGSLEWTAEAAAKPVAAPLDLRGLLAELGDEALDGYLADEALRPFDLRRERPFRAVLARLAERDWALVITIDHIACDGVSLGVFLTDLADAYNRLVDAGDLAPTGARYTYADYCRWEQGWLGRRGSTPAPLAAELAAGPVARSLALPGRPSGPGTGRHSWSTDSELTEGIRTLAGRTGTTPFIVFATALSSLLHSGSAGRETTLLGTLVAQRDRAEWQRVVGPLLNVSVVGAGLSLSDTGTAALLCVRDGVLRAYRERHLPFQDLAAMLRPVAGPDGDPFEVMLVMQPTTKVPVFAGLTTTLTELEPGGAPYPLTVDVEPADGVYRVSFRYARDRFADADMPVLAERMRGVLTALAHEPEATLAAALARTGHSLEPEATR
ncbi:amino acid adenylation domain-containing protein [Micromonospora sp. NPDC047467]|uniref:amino acid adenylation domain-containing protein n=1 Tax=Micromonospora sp. NPDC047467 TaxID=3154814 RepID=UPI0033E0AD23